MRQSAIQVLSTCSLTTAEEDRKLSEFFGCFARAVGNGTSLEQIAPSSNQMTPVLCREMALNTSKGYSHYAILNGRTCFAGQGLSDVDALPGVCSSSCAGDTRLTCGGLNSFSVFKVPDIGGFQDTRTVISVVSPHAKISTRFNF